MKFKGFAWLSTSMAGFWSFDPSTHVNQKKFHTGKFLSGIFNGFRSWGVIIIGETPAGPVWRSHIFPNPWGISNERRHQRGDVRAIRHLAWGPGTILPRSRVAKSDKIRGPYSVLGIAMPWEKSMAYWDIVEIYGNLLGMWLNFHVHGILRCWWGDLPFQLPPWEFSHFIKAGMVWWRMKAAFPTWESSKFKSLVPKKRRHPSFLVTSPHNSKPYLDVHTNYEWAIYLAGDTPYIAGQKKNVCHPLVCPV